MKPLTVFVGKNNTGKTWLVYTIAGSLGHYSWSRYLSAYLSGQTCEKHRPLAQLVRRVAEQGRAACFRGSAGQEARALAREGLWPTRQRKRWEREGSQAPQ